MSAVFLTDFGLARLTETGSRLTRTGQALGTPSYMSPEQARGEVATLTPAADVWSLGCVCYQLLAGGPPFEGATPAAVIGQVLVGTPPPLRARGADLPPGLESLVLAMLARRPADRPADAAAVSRDLARVLRGERPLARRPRSRTRWLAGASLSVPLLGVAVWVVWPAAGPDERAVRAAALAARGLEAAGADPARAAQWLGDALALVPDRHDWRMARGQQFWLAGDAARARAEWDAVPDDVAESAAARLYTALEGFVRTLDTGRQEPLRPLVERASTAPGDVGALARGLLALSDRDHGRARAELRGVSGWAGHLMRAQLELADPAGSRTQALREYDAAFASGIRSAWMVYNRAESRLQVGDFVGAIADCTEALRLRPGYPTAWLCRAAAHQRLGDTASALADLDGALAADPGSRLARYNRGVAHRLLGHADAAIADFTEVLRVEPGHRDAAYQRARTAFDRDDFSAALADLDATLARHPDHAAALATRGATRLALGELPQARSDLDAAIALAPDEASAYFDRATVRRRLGDATGAAEDLETTLRLDPGHVEALGNRGAARARGGDWAGALLDYDASLRIRPSAETHYNRGLARGATGDLPGAAADFGAAVRLDPSLIQAHANLGQTLERLGDVQGAVTAYRAFLRLAPGHAHAAALRARLVALGADAGGD